MNRKLTFSLVLVMLALTVSVTAVFAATKSYHSTTVTYNNRITDQGDCCWNAGWIDSTSPSLSMDTFGPSVATSYISCNNVINYSTWRSTNNVYRYNVTSTADGAALVKSIPCSGQTRRLHDDVQHYWQDGAFAGDGGTLSTSLIH